MRKPLYHTPLGYSTRRPDIDIGPIDRRALMRNAHCIAARVRPHMQSYREALAYGLRAAWHMVNVARSIASLRALVAPRPLTDKEIEQSRAATRRCGSSYIGM
jgi:hypothetical protein